MRWLAERIGIPFDPRLLEPTFNGRPVRANSSEALEAVGVLPERAGAYRDALGDADLVRIDELAGELYKTAVAATPEALRPE